MSLLTISEIKTQLNIDDDMQSDSAHLFRLANVAKIAIENKINRVIYTDEATLAAEIVADTAPANALISNEAIKQAALLLVGDMYENREITVIGTIVARNDYVLSMLLDPYRYVSEV